MNNKQITELIYIFKMNYQHSYGHFSETDMRMTIKLWSEYLKDCNYTIVMQAAKNLLGKHIYPPVISDIIQEYNNLLKIQLEYKKKSAINELNEKRQEEERENAELLGYYEKLSDEIKLEIEIMVSKEILDNFCLRGLEKIARLICIEKYRNMQKIGTASVRQ